jgi:hypothetical protein
MTTRGLIAARRLRSSEISPAVALRPVEHLMSPDPAPDDMRLTFADRRCECESRATIRGEAKLVDAAMAGEGIDERLAGHSRRRLA